MDSGEVAFAKKLKTLILGLMPFYMEWIADIRATIAALGCMATCICRLNNRALEAENPEEDEEDECTHNLRMQKKMERSRLAGQIEYMRHLL